MPSVRKYGKITRPSILKMRNQLQKKSRTSSSRNALFAKLKANNNGLAKALSKEKEENKYLFADIVSLRKQLQDLQLSLNRKNEVFKLLLQKSTESSRLMYEGANSMLEIVEACENMIGCHSQNIPRNNLSRMTIDPDKSVRQSVTVKSPARGVVQPMVAGLTIAKPIINLSRISMPRIHRTPGLSDIEEVISPENSPVTAQTNTPEVTINCQRRFSNKRVEKILPERITVTPTAMRNERLELSGNNDRRPRKYSRRNSKKKTASQPENFESRLSSELNGSIRNPTVTLQDVSKLMQKNLQSSNTRNLSASTARDVSPSLRVSSPNYNSIKEQSNNNLDEQLLVPSVPIHSPNILELKNIDLLNESQDTFTYHIDLKEKKSKVANNSSKTSPEDPLEGPSWLYNQSTILDNSSSMPLSVSITEPSGDKSTIKWLRHNGTILENNENNYDGKADSDEDDDVCTKIDLPSYTINGRKMKTDDNNSYDETPRMYDNVTISRGRINIDDDDFTMCINPKRKAPRMSFDINSLQLPQLEKPLINQKLPEAEPEITTTINILPQNSHDILIERNERPMTNFSVSIGRNRDINEVNIPIIQDSIRVSELLSINSSENYEQSDESVVNKNDSERIVKIPFNDSERSPSPVRREKISKIKKKNIKRKDPSSAKVVLQKLDNDFKHVSLPRESIFPPSPHSDSESSNASNRTSSGRPKREKAPKNLREPSLVKKLRQ